jgi:hypothetical protein
VDILLKYIWKKICGPAISWGLWLEGELYKMVKFNVPYRESLDP